MSAVAVGARLGQKSSSQCKGETSRRAGRGSFLRFLLLMTALAGCFFFARWALNHVAALKLFPLERVVFSGNKRLSPETLFRLSGVRQGEDLFAISLPQLRAHLEEHPLVKRAHVQRLFPQTLRIEVKERKGVALVKLSRFYLVDEEGVILEPWEEGAHRGEPLPRIEGLTIKGARPGERLNDPSFNRALKAARLLSLIPPLSEKEVSVELGPEARLRARALGGRLFMELGDGPVEAKLERLEAVLPDILKKRGRDREVWLDLSFEGRIILRPPEKGGERGP